MKLHHSCRAARIQEKKTRVRTELGSRASHTPKVGRSTMSILMQRKSVNWHSDLGSAADIIPPCAYLAILACIHGYTFRDFARSSVSGT